MSSFEASSGFWAAKEETADLMDVRAEVNWVESDSRLDAAC